MHLLVESRGGSEASRFISAARNLAATGTPTIVYLIDDGVGCAVGARPEITELVGAGGSVWADDLSLAQREIPAVRLAAGIIEAGMDKVAPLLFDPAVKVVWH